MVVAIDRYVAEDAAERIVVTYDVLPPVVGVDNARRAERRCTTTCPTTSLPTCCRRRRCRVGDGGRPAHYRPRGCPIERSASMPMEGKVFTPAGTPPMAHERPVLPRPRQVYAPRSPRSSTCRSNKVHCVAPMVGGGSA